MRVYDFFIVNLCVLRIEVICFLLERTQKRLTRCVCGFVHGLVLIALPRQLPLADRGLCGHVICKI